jgi:hypothetical protein
MDGDIAPLPALLALAERYDAWLRCKRRTSPRPMRCSSAPATWPTWPW